MTVWAGSPEGSGNVLCEGETIRKFPGVMVWSCQVEGTAKVRCRKWCSGDTPQCE